MDIIDYITQIHVEIKAEREELLPVYASEHASGADIKANITEDIILKPFERILVPTGLFVAIPPGYEIQVRPRSGLAIKEGITVLNTPGTIDADYRGQLQVILINLGTTNFVIKPLMRIAQIVIQPVVRAHFTPVVMLSDTTRGTGGFGHTGVL